MNQLWHVRNVMDGGKDGKEMLLTDRPFMDCLTFAKNYVEREGGNAIVDTEHLFDTSYPAVYVRNIDVRGKSFIVCVQSYKD